MGWILIIGSDHIKSCCLELVPLLFINTRGIRAPRYENIITYNIITRKEGRNEGRKEGDIKEMENSKYGILLWFFTVYYGYYGFFLGDFVDSGPKKKGIFIYACIYECMYVCICVCICEYKDLHGFIP